MCLGATGVVSGWLDCDRTHPRSPTRPDSDRAILREIGRQLGTELSAT